MTANALIGDRERCIEAGMDDYLPKPVTREQLAAALTVAASRPRTARLAVPAGQDVAPLLLTPAVAMEPFSLRVLVADDNLVNRELATAQFESLGYHIDIATDGTEVLEVMAHSCFDVVFMDVQMPRLDGLPATRAICAQKGLQCQSSHSISERGHVVRHRRRHQHGQVRRQPGIRQGFQVETGGNLNDPSLCVISTGPEGMVKGDTRMGVGLAARKLMPTPARIRLQSDQPGIKLAGFLGNLRGYLIFNSAGRAIIEQFCDGQKIEYLPFELINHKGRVHSTDYAIITPLGGFDALNEEASAIDRSPKDGHILDVSNIVLDTNKLKAAPALFRLAQKPVEYVMSQALIDAFKAAKVNNLAYRYLAQQTSR